MSITRLRQARQMYAMGQRVGRIAFGGGGSYSSQGGYQGGGDGKGGKAGGAGTGVDGQGGTGNSSNNAFSGNTQVVDTTSNKYTETPLANMTTIPMDIKEQYRLGTKIDPPSTFTNTHSVTFNQPYMTKGLETIRKDNYLDRLNLAGSTYQKANIPPFIPGGMFMNTVGNFLGGLGFEKNKNFFAKNVAGKYGYGYGIKDYERYMSDRTSGKVGAYGNENMGQNAINARAGDGTQGIMDINIDNNVGDADGDGDVDQDDFIFKYFDKTGETLQAGAGGVQDLMSSIRERISNLFS